MSEDRYTYPAEGQDPRDVDREFQDAETQARLQRTRHTTNAQEPERHQGTSADAPGHDPSSRNAT